MAKKIQLQDASGNVLHPLTLGECVTMDNGENLDTLMSKSQMFTPTITQDKSMFKVGTGVDVDYSANVKDGAYESLVFKGKSLVNLASEKTKSFTTSHFLRCTLSHELVNGKKYLLKWDITNNTIGAFDVRFLRTSDGVRSGAFTLNVPKVVTVTNDGFDAIEFFTNASSISQGLTATIDNIMVVEYVEGMENNISYFEGLCDVKMPILRNVGKNLCPPLIVGSTINNNNGQIITDDTVINCARTDYIKINPKKNYIISGINNTDKTLVGFYDENKNYLSRTSGTSHSRISLTPDTSVSFPVYTIPQNASYIILSYYGDNLSAFDKANAPIQIEETLGVNADNVTTHEDHKTNILTTPEEIVLREVSGIQDTYDAITGEYTQRIGERDYVDEDFTNANIKTDGVKTQYVLNNPIVTNVKPSTMTPFAYQNGHVIVESGFEGQSLLPEIEYSVVTGRTGQVTQNTKVLRQQEQQIIGLEELLLTQVVQMEYERTLLQFDYELQMMMLG